MLRKFSWGQGIFVLYTAFVGMIIFFVFKSTNEKIDLVTPDYYKQELLYQDKLDRIERTNKLTEIPAWVIDSKHITITFPDDMKEVVGEVLFFKPSDKNLDHKLPIELTDGSMTVPFSELSHGAYKLQLSWKHNGEEYFKEGVIFID